MRRPARQTGKGRALVRTVTLVVCTTCRNGPPEGGDAPRDGQRLFDALQAADLPEGVRLRGVECLSACTRGCTVALSAPGRWSYVQGGLHPALHLPDILTAAALYAAAPDGLVPWRARPEIIRKGTVARIPPMEVS